MCRCFQRRKQNKGLHKYPFPCNPSMQHLQSSFHQTNITFMLTRPSHRCSQVRLRRISPHHYLFLASTALASIFFTGEAARTQVRYAQKPSGGTSDKWNYARKYFKIQGSDSASSLRLCGAKRR